MNDAQDMIDLFVTEPILAQEIEFPQLDLSFDRLLGGIGEFLKENTENVEDDKQSPIPDIIDDIVSAAWNQMKKSKSNCETPSALKRAKHYPCEKCGKMFSQFSSAVKHCSIEKPVETGAVCPVCGTKLLLKRSLKRHMQTMHGPGKKVIQDAPQNKQTLFKCDECEQEYSSRNKLVEHMHNKHGVPRKEGPLIRCSECDFSHISNSRVKAHFTLKHTFEQSFRCLDCLIQFKSTSGLQKHRTKVHKSDTVKSISTLPPVQPGLFVARKSLPLPMNPLVSGDPIQNMFNQPSTNVQLVSQNTSYVIFEVAEKTPGEIENGELAAEQIQSSSEPTQI